jgi:O-acetyl-ADP-ribose deacetylase (regulator of RNase III)
MSSFDPVDSGFVQLIRGDITRQQVDAIVNAANSSLLGGGGVDGAIHRVAGPELLEACRPLGGCRPGEAKITPGFNLPASYVIHTVGPVWHGGHEHEDAVLAKCYRSVMHLAAANRIRSIAFPSISTGAYGFPVHRAAPIALRELHRCLDHFPDIENVRIVCHSADVFRAYEEAMQDYLD